MRRHFTDSFSHDVQNSYPSGWICDTLFELPFKQGSVRDGRFHLDPCGTESRHIIPSPDLETFKLEFDCQGDSFFPKRCLNVFFHYNQDRRQGLMIRYEWGAKGRKTHWKQTDAPGNYRCQIVKYDGTAPQNEEILLRDVELEGFVENLDVPQNFQLEFNRERRLVFTHGGHVVMDARIPRDADWRNRGTIAFSRSDHAGALSLKNVAVLSDETVNEVVIRKQTKTRFPSSVNRLVSSYCFHVGITSKVTGDCSRKYLNLELSGGPSKEPIYPEIDRQRFNEKMTNPYVRIEDRQGETLGKYYIFKGDVGLDSYHWNTSCSVLLPADGICPLTREVMLADPPDDALFFIGYESYFAEDSIGASGGPAEVLINADGDVLWFGEKFEKGDAAISLRSPIDEALRERIPEDIPFFEDALAFAQNNHFFVQGEKTKFQVSIDSRDDMLSREILKARIRVEDVFGERIRGEYDVNVTIEETISAIPGAKRFRTTFFDIPELPVGVYHLNVEVEGFGDARRVRRAFEVMPRDPCEKSAPLVSGLPELYPNILSGITNEHFHPWGAETLDAVHYNSGGNNYFKVARTWRVTELLHAYGRKFNCWLKPKKTIFDERGIEPNADLIRRSDGVHITLSRMSHGDLWGRERYGDPRRFGVLLEFLRSDAYEKVKNAHLDYDTLRSRGPGEALTTDEYEELVSSHWKAWTKFYCEWNRLEYQKRFRRIKEINPTCEPFVHGGTYPTYASGYKMGYFPLSCGFDLRDGQSEFLTGPNSFEDYPYSSGYPSARGICHLMASKLEDPELKLFPESFGVNGETLDPRVVAAHPPYGRSNPPRGFLKTLFFEYSFAAVWFDAKGFNFWNDHGYHVKTWSRENYSEMLEAYSFISKVKPQKPLRAPAYAYGREACLAHDEFNEDLGGVNSTVVNTAEEVGAFAYERGRTAGLQAGFVLRLEDCGELQADDVDFLVIPPLTGVDEKTKRAIRELHERGVPLLGFEDASGLEDLFGIEESVPIQASEITPDEEMLTTNLASLREETKHPLCVIKHKLKGARGLLKDASGAPVLTMFESGHAKTAFFTLPPTFVKRSRNSIPTYGQRSNSELVNQATGLVQKMLSRSHVTTSAGTLIAFEDEKNDIHVIVSENSCPLPGKTIRPFMKFNIPKIRPEDISADGDFELLTSDDKSASLRFSLDAYQTMRFTIRRNETRSKEGKQSP